MKSTVFDRFHPSIAFAYFICVLIFAMVNFHPVYIGIAFISALLYSIFLRGAKSTCKTLAWQLPFICLIALMNSLFSALGSHELFCIGPYVACLESLSYGACMGTMLASVYLWFSCMDKVISSEKLFALIGKKMPNIATMISGVMRLVPLFVGRARLISCTQKACTAAYNNTQSIKRQRTVKHMRIINVLFGWSMEESLITAQTMRVCGFENTRNKTSYSRYMLRLRDVCALIFILCFFALNAFFAFVVSSHFSFYPSLSAFSWQWSFVPYALFMCAPLIGEMYN